MSDQIVTRRHRARKTHQCWGCDGPVKAGQIYLAHTSFPGHDSGYATYAGHPVRSVECERCAIRYGRGDLL